MSDRKAETVLSETQTPHGYVIREEIWPGMSFSVVLPDDADDEMQGIAEAIDGDHGSSTMTTCYTNAGHWIGDEKVAKRLCEDMGIAPEPMDPREPGILRPCSVGFCEAEQKWYGWSHRAICGFGIGSTVTFGDCAYNAPTKEAFGRQMMEFFTNGEYQKNPRFADTVNADGQRGVLIQADYTDDVPNERLRGTVYETFWPYPEQFGRGEWVAETLEDAKQMAKDFAEGVS